MSGKLEQRIQSAHLTRTEKVIADYFLEHSGSLYFLTAKDIALALGVSDTSVIRLCRTLGYRGFRELQDAALFPEQPDTELRFKLPYLVTDRRLAAPQLPGRARKTPRPGRQTKALQPLQHSAAEFFTRLSRHVPPPPA